MADKLTTLILNALTRAATEPHGVAVVALRGEPGLFPNTLLAKTAARRCLEEGFLQPIGANDSRGTVERCRITEKGLAHLVEMQNPRAVLHDLVRVLENRSSQVTELLASAKSMAENLKGLQAMLSAVLPKVTTMRVAVDADVTQCVVAALTEWNQAEDCSLPELYRRLPMQPGLGAFHDALRALNGQGRLELHPWTGPLYAIPEPSFAMLAGHEVAYYASMARRHLEIETLRPEVARSMA